MKLSLRRTLLLAAPVLCVSLIGAALLRGPSRPAATIADLQVDPAVYNGAIFSNTQPSTQNEGFGIKVIAKNGSKFTGITTFSGLEGSVSSSGKFTAKTIPLKMTSARLAGGERPRTFGPVIDTVSFKGQLSADGSAILGTYKIKGEAADKGTFYLLLADN